jgi:hypothetical protein
MTIAEVKQFISQIPDSMNHFNVVNGEFGVAKDGKTFVMTNNEVLTAFVDERNQEVQFLHQTDKDVHDMILGLDGDSE